MIFRKISTSACLLLSLLLFLHPAQAELLLSGATIFTAPDKEAIQGKTVLIKDGRIASVMEDIDSSIGKAVDLTDKYLMAGFWNNHVHYLFEEYELKSGNQHLLEEKLTDMFLSRGFVSTVDTGSFPGIIIRIKSKIESGEMTGPRIYRMGGSFVPEGGSPFYIAPVKLPELVSVEQTKQITREALEDEVEGIIYDENQKVHKQI